MTGRYLTDLAAVLRAAGLTVVELDGWQTRARSSGGYPDGGPWAVFWHHTASGGDGAADADYCTYGSPDAPVCNLVVGRDALVYVCAAGATNTNGKGGPHLLPDGRTLPLDGANSRVFGMELSNGGTGMSYPAAQIDAAFASSNAVAAAYGIRADNVVTHQVWAPDRKIDPATAAAVQGSWRPPSCSSSGSWELAALRAECVRRTTGSLEEADMTPEQAATLDRIAAQVAAISDTVWKTTVPDGVTGADAHTWTQIVNANGNAAAAFGAVADLRAELVAAGVIP